MTAVPLSMLGLLLATDDDVRVVMTTPVGATCLVAGLTLNASGWMWMRHIVEGPA
jgi:Flp pilus assembly protein TadB